MSTSGGAGGAGLGSWTSYDPVVGGTGWALGNGTLSAAYLPLGASALLIAQDLVLGSTSVVGSGQLSLSLPAGYTVASGFNQFLPGKWNYQGNYQCPSLMQPVSGGTTVNWFVMLNSAEIVNLESGSFSTAPAAGSEFQASGVVLLG